MRKLAYITKIKTVTELPESNLDVVSVEGVLWRTVVSRGYVAPGDKVVFFEADSFLPIKEEFEFLRRSSYRAFADAGGNTIDEGFRVKNTKMRGFPCQGLVVRTDRLPSYSDHATRLCLKVWGVGENVTQLLGVRHYDHVKEKYIGGSVNNLGDFPTSIGPIMDLDRLQILPWMFEHNQYDLYEVTEKNDGSCMMAAWNPNLFPDNPFVLCSRNTRIDTSSDKGIHGGDIQARIMCLAKELKLEDRLRKYNKSIAIYGEIVGPGIQSNKDKYEDTNFNVFGIFNTPNNCWMPAAERYLVCEDLGLQHVKVVHKALKFFEKCKTIEDALAFVDVKTERGNTIEGYVFKEINGAHSFKVINEKYR